MIKCKLGELLKIKHGYAFKSENYVSKSKYALVTLANISENNNFKFNCEKTTFYDGEFPNEFILKEEDLVMPLTEQVIGLIGNSAFIPKMKDITFVLNQRVGKVICDENKINKYYLHYLLSTQIVKEQLEYRASGTKQRNISPENVYDVTVYIPELELQNKIGTLLYNIETKINTNNKIISELESMAKTIYDYWFLQYEFPNEDGKPYKSNGGKMVYNENLKREIPEGWNVKSIKECIEHINTGLNPRNNFVLGNGSIKYITVKNLTKEGIFNYDGCDVIDEKAKKIVHNRSDVDVGDILFASIAPLGRCFMVQEYPSEWDINESVFCIRPKQQIISTEYLYLYFTSEMFIKQAENSSTGSIFSGIRINTLESMNLLVPSEKVKESFAHNLKNIFLKKYKIAKENEELTNLKDYLLPLLMNGQVSFKN